MYDLKNVTFVIPFRNDSKQRIFNLETILKYLNYNFDTNIIVGEEKSNTANNINSKYEYKKFNYNINFFHRTRLLNDLYKLCKTDIIVNYDSDVLFTINNYTEAKLLIDNRSADVVYPYDGVFFDVNQMYHKQINDSCNIEHILNVKHRVRNANSFGGCVFFSKSSLYKSGMENEHFKSWGFEDNERFIRFTKLGFIIKRLNGRLYHMMHPKGSDSSKSNPFYNENKSELDKISNMNKEEIIKYLGLSNEDFR